jgi:hypothetical protein
LGLQAKSFDLAAEAYEDAVGSSMSADSLIRVTVGTGPAMAKHRDQEVADVYARPEAERYMMVENVAVVAGMEGQGNISTDGGMVHIRDEGWKEVKLTTISEVEVQSTQCQEPLSKRSEQGEEDPKSHLGRHSYQARLWNADEMEQYQYLAGLRRGLDGCEQLSSVKAGAHVTFGERTQMSKQWVEIRLDHLWDGNAHSVVKALPNLALEHKEVTDVVRQTPEYFNTRQSKMDYAHFRQQGFPIGSGTVESGINTVVHHRMKRPGRGWVRNHAQAMLAGLSELHSGRFDLMWQSTNSSCH